MPIIWVSTFCRTATPKCNPSRIGSHVAFMGLKADSFLTFGRSRSRSRNAGRSCVLASQKTENTALDRTIEPAKAGRRNPVKLEYSRILFQKRRSPSG
ncbi:hypothetical protein [Oxynema aestuarii]|uniref:Uncharacterized protein n=1 Tax=Oxynema aestuarii AP17 TaxID=2064643 RepID=A0A6H1TSF3_9CYAN|nr:hypothetical protein [Oxynema aestuarii]QIZ69471.1 hypothetical protein HCG48_01775 [Oxynema aestuarii AP17]